MVWKKLTKIVGEDGRTPLVGVDFPFPPPGKDGKDADANEVAKIVLKQIPKPNDGLNGADGSPDTPSQIVDKLETLEGEDRLDAKAIKNLPEPKIIHQGGGGGGIRSVRAGTGISIDESSLNHPIISADLEALDDTFLKLDQTTPQTILNDTFKLDTLKSKLMLATDANGKIIEGSNAAADGSTKGIAGFVAADFTASSGIISLANTHNPLALQIFS